MPVALDRIIKTCLAKSPDERFQTSPTDLLLQLRWLDPDAPAAGSSATARASVPSTAIESRRGRFAIVGTAGLVVGAAVAMLGTWLSRPVEPAERPPTRFTFQPPSDLNVLVSGNQGVLAVSRDGRVIASIVEPRRQVFIRSLDRPDGRILDGIDNAAWPFFSPDGKSIGFFVGSQLRRVSVDGGTPINIGNVSPTAAVWLDEPRRIVVGQNSGGLLRIPASGGVAQPLLELEPGESGHIMPEVIPGTDVLLFSSPLTVDAPRVMAVRLGTLRRQLVLERGARPSVFVERPSAVRRRRPNHGRAVRCVDPDRQRRTSARGRQRELRRARPTLSTPALRRAR